MKFHTSRVKTFQEMANIYFKPTGSDRPVRYGGNVTNVHNVFSRCGILRTSRVIGPLPAPLFNTFSDLNYTRSLWQKKKERFIEPLQAIWQTCSALKCHCIGFNTERERERKETYLQCSVPAEPDRFCQLLALSDTRLH